MVVADDVITLEVGQGASDFQYPLTPSGRQVVVLSHCLYKCPVCIIQGPITAKIRAIQLRVRYAGTRQLAVAR